MTAALVLWGSHPRYVGGEPIKLTSGSLRECRAAQSVRERDGGWRLAIYNAGTAPTGLRLLAAHEHQFTYRTELDDFVCGCGKYAA